MRRESGSTLPLVLALAALLLGLTMALSEILSLRLAQDRTKADANFAVLYTLKQLGDIDPVLGLDYSQVVVAQLPDVLELHVASEDGRTLHARLCERWQSPLGIHPDSRVCDEASARLTS